MTCVFSHDDTNATNPCMSLICSLFFLFVYFVQQTFNIRVTKN